MEQALTLQPCIHVLTLKPTELLMTLYTVTCTYIEAHGTSSDITALYTYTCTYIEAHRASSIITETYTYIEAHGTTVALALQPCIQVLTGILKPTELVLTLQPCINVHVLTSRPTTSSDITALN